MWPTLKLRKILLIVTLDKTLRVWYCDAGGEFLDAFNNLVLIANIDPESTPAWASWPRDMMTLAGDFKTDEYQEASARNGNTIGNANIGEDGKLLTNPDGTPLSTAAKVWNTIKAVGGALHRPRRICF